MTSEEIQERKREGLKPYCPCSSGEYREAEYDGQGIFLCYACDECRKEKLSHYRPEILSRYSEADVDEPIEAEEY